jgi:hypothetical protein
MGQASNRTGLQGSWRLSRPSSYKLEKCSEPSHNHQASSERREKDNQSRTSSLPLFVPLAPSFRLGPRVLDPPISLSRPGESLKKMCVSIRTRRSRGIAKDTFNKGGAKKRNAYVRDSYIQYAGALVCQEDTAKSITEW